MKLCFFGVLITVVISGIAFAQDKTATDIQRQQEELAAYHIQRELDLATKPYEPLPPEPKEAYCPADRNVPPNGYNVSRENTCAMVYATIDIFNAIRRPVESHPKSVSSKKYIYTSEEAPIKSVGPKLAARVRENTKVLVDFFRLDANRSHATQQQLSSNTKATDHERKATSSSASR